MNVSQDGFYLKLRIESNELKTIDSASKTAKTKLGLRKVRRTSFGVLRLSFTDYAMLCFVVLFSPVIWDFLSIGFWAKSNFSDELLSSTKHPRVDFQKFSLFIILSVKCFAFLFLSVAITCRSWNHSVLRKFPSSVHFVNVNNKNRGICSQ